MHMLPYSVQSAYFSYRMYKLSTLTLSRRFCSRVGCVENDMDGAQCRLFADFALYCDKKVVYPDGWLASVGLSVFGFLFEFTEVLDQAGTTAWFSGDAGVASV